MSAKEQDPRTAQAEKLAAQAETGGGRTLARPASVGTNETETLADAVRPPATGTSGMSGIETNDAMPGGGATGDRPQADTVAATTSDGGAA